MTLSDSCSFNEHERKKNALSLSQIQSSSPVEAPLNEQTRVIARPHTCAAQRRCRAVIAYRQTNKPLETRLEAPAAGRDGLRTASNINADIRGCVHARGLQQTEIINSDTAANRSLRASERDPPTLALIDPRGQ